MVALVLQDLNPPFPGEARHLARARHYRETGGEVRDGGVDYVLRGEHMVVRKGREGKRGCEGGGTCPVREPQRAGREPCDTPPVTCM